MEHIIREHGLWPEAGLPVECAGPKHLASEGQASCCCRHILYTQPNFMSQKPLLQEYIESRGHFTGVLQSFGSALLAVQGPLMRWKRKCWHVLMMSPLNKSEDLRTGQRALSLPIVRVCPVPKQRGPTRSTMGIPFCPLI